MPSPSRPSPPRRTTANALDEGSSLANSLQQLSLAANSLSTPPKHALSRRSSILSADPRRACRTPSQDARTASPPVIRCKASASSLRSVSVAAGAASGRVSMSRRSSSGRVVSPTAARTAPAALQEDERPFVTANLLARNHFKAELSSHHGLLSALPTETIIVLNDAVYGHRFSRPRTSRSALGTIVERPERIKAIVLGISTAYVRLGGRHDQGAVPIHPDADAQAVPGIPFRIHKTTRRLPLASPAVTNVHGTKWMEELKVMCDSAEAKLAMGGKELQRPDMNRGSDAEPPQKLHQGDLYLCSESLEAMEGALGAVCEAVDAVFTSPHRRAFVGARPPGHHCSASHPSGFCWVNNVHVGIMHAALVHGLTHAAIIDFDLHHGDGSQDITWQHNSRARVAAKNASAWKKTSIGYFSLHDINSYPCEYGDDEKVQNASICIDNAHAQTIWNLHLQSWKTEDEFWRLYESKYIILIEKTRNYLRKQAWRLKELGQVPKAAIFLSAGFDASEWESAGMQRHQVNVPTEFYARMAQDVVKVAAEEGLYVDGRIVSVLEGGYSDRALASGVMSHLSGLVGDQSLNKEPQRGMATSTAHMGRNGFSSMGLGSDHRRALESLHAYDASWWQSGELDKLENPPDAPSPPRKPRNMTPPTYCSPTQASTAKVVDPAKMRRSLSGLHSVRIERVPTPPPPEVSWVVAAHELCKLLVPSDRQTESCKPEDLNAEATRARRDRQTNLLGLAAPPPEAASRPTSRIALRERKPKFPVSPDEDMFEQLAKSRRKTDAVVTASSAKVGMQLRKRQGADADASLGQTSSRKTPPIPSASAVPAVGRVSRRLSGESAVPDAAKDALNVPKVDAASRRSPPVTSAPTTQTNGKLAVKKTRATAATRGAKASRSPKKCLGQVSGVSSSSPSTATSVTSHDMADAMDSITTGMKKIRIKLITESQREATVQAPHVAENTAVPSEGSVPPMVKQQAGVEQGPKSEVEPFTADTMPAQTAATKEEDLADPLMLVAQQPGVSFVPYQPLGPAPVAMPMEQQAQLHWLPPNLPTPLAGTPSLGEEANGLFQYTSGIPFAPQSSGAQQARSEAADAGQVKTEGSMASVWEVPETPKR